MKPKNLFITVLIIATILFTFIFVSALKVENLTCEKSNTSLYIVSAETETFETNSTMCFQYFNSTWQFINGDDYPTEINGKYKWTVLWDTSTLADGPYTIKAEWYTNSTKIGESDFLTVNIDSNPPGPPPITTTPPPTTPPASTCIDFYSKEFLIPHTYSTYNLILEIEDKNKAFVFYVKNKGTTSLESLNIVGYAYYENVRWQVASTHLEPNAETQATLNIKGSEIDHSSSYTFAIMNGGNKLKTIKLTLIKNKVDKIKDKDLNPLLDGEKYGIVLPTPKKTCTVTINTKGLTEEQLRSLCLVYKGDTISLTGETTQIEIDADYGVINSLYLYQKIGDQYSLIHSWTIEQQQQTVTYDINAQDIDNDGYLELTDSVDEVTVSFIIPKKGDITLQGIDNNRDEVNPNVRFAKKLLSAGKYKIILEAEGYITIILKLEVKKIETPIPTILPPTTLPPTTSPPTTLPPTLPPSGMKIPFKYIGGIIVIALIGFGLYYKQDLIKDKIKKFKTKRKFKKTIKKRKEEIRENLEEKPTKKDIIKKIDKIDKKREGSMTKEQKIEFEKLKRDLENI